MIFLLITAFVHGNIKGGIEKSINHTGENVSFSLEMKSAFSLLPSWGHYPLQVTIRNTGILPVELSLHSLSYSRLYYYRNRKKCEHEASYTLRCPVGEEKVYDLLIPVSRIVRPEYSYRDTGSSSLELNYRYRGESVETTYLNADLKDHDKSLTDVYSENILPRTLDLNHDYICVLNTELLPTNLKGLTGYDKISLLESEYETLNSAQKRALKQWVKMGGKLTICSLQPHKLVKVLQSEDKNLTFKNYNYKSARASQVANLGSGVIFTFLIDSEKENFYVDLNHHLEKSKTLNEKIDLLTINRNFSAIESWRLLEKLGGYKMGIVLFLLLLIIFVILVGPINFFVLTNRNTRYKLLVTTPLISIVMSGVFILLIILSDGFGGNGQRILIKNIDTKEKKAFIYQEQVSRTGVLLGSDFSLPSEMQISQVSIPKSRYSRVSPSKRNTNESYQERTGENQVHYSGSYFSSRSENGHVLVGTQVTQSAVTINNEGEQLVIESTLEETLEEIYIRYNGKLYHAKNLKTGGAVVLVEIKSHQWNKIQGKYVSLFTKDFGEILTKLSMRENSYMAYSSKTNGVETFTSIDWETEAIVTGTFTN